MIKLPHSETLNSVYHTLREQFTDAEQDLLFEVAITICDTLAMKTMINESDDGTKVKLGYVDDENNEISYETLLFQDEQEAEKFINEFNSDPSKPEEDFAKILVKEEST